MRKILIPVLALTVGVTTAQAQNASPRENPSVSVGGKAVSVEYGRPSLGNRTVDSLLSQLQGDRTWRAGSEQVSTFTTEGDVVVGDQKVPAGKYSLYLHVAEEGPVSLVLNSVLGQPLIDIYPAAPEQLKQAPWPHFDYQKQIGDKEVARAAMTKSEASESVDMFTIALDAADGGATLSILWGDAAWSVGIKPAM
jgi:hypothetical protein